MTFTTPPFSERILDYNQDIIARCIKTLNRQKTRPIPLDIAFRKWRCSFGYSPSEAIDWSFYNQLSKKTIHHISLGVERGFRSLPFLYVDAHLSYFSTKIHGRSTSNLIAYNKKQEVTIFKLNTNLRLDCFPQRRVAPFISIGYILSIPTKYKRTLTILDTSSGSFGLPSFQVVDANFSPEIGKFIALGCRANLSEKTRLNFFIQIEVFQKRIDFSTYNEPFTNLSQFQKTTPDEGLVSLSISRSF